MSTIRITITSEKTADVVITEQRPEAISAKRKEALAQLDALFKPVLKNTGK
ncbi:MAG: hypothetical protein P4N59_29450 [Negativicutes bacterium]|nr:hypothetical protein [Negativicutes bacterium]